MVEWSREYYIDPNTTGLNAVYRSETGTAPESETQSEAAATDTQELQPSSGRQVRGSFSTLRAETSEKAFYLPLLCKY